MCTSLKILTVLFAKILLEKICKKTKDDIVAFVLIVLDHKDYENYLIIEKN